MDSDPRNQLLSFQETGRRYAPLGVLGLGLACGLAAKIGDESTWRWATDLGTYPALWVFSIAMFGRFSPSAISAATRSAAFSVCAILAYYTWSIWVLEYGVGSYPALWLVVSLTAAPLLATAVWFGANQYIPSWLIAAPISGLILADGPLRQYWNEITIDLPSGFPFHPVQAGVDIILAVATIAFLNHRRSDRVASALLAIPFMLVAERAVDTLRSVTNI